MPANYHHIYTAGSAPQLQILSVGARTVLKHQIIMAHLRESIVKRKILRDPLENKRGTFSEENEPFLRQQNKQISVSITLLQCKQCC